MQKLKDMHEGHVDKCCCCIDVNTGAKILGWLFTIAAVLILAESFLYLPYSLVMLIIGLPQLYVGFKFFKVIRDDSTEHKHAYRDAFNLYTKIMYVFLVLYLIFGIASIFLGAGVGGFISALITVLIQFVIFSHYNKVVRTYAEDAHHKGEGFTAQ